MTRQNLLGLPWSSALQHKIHVHQGFSQYFRTAFIVHQLQPYRDNKLKNLLTAVSDFTHQRQVTTVSLAVFLLVVYLQQHQYLTVYSIY